MTVGGHLAAGEKECVQSFRQPQPASCRQVVALGSWAKDKKPNAFCKDWTVL